MIRITIEFESGWYELTKEFIEKFKAENNLKSYKIEIIKEKKVEK